MIIFEIITHLFYKIKFEGNIKMTEEKILTKHPQGKGGKKY